MSSSRLAFFIVIVSSFGCKDIVISLSEGKNNINVTTKTNHEQASTLPNVEEETTTEENLVGSAGAALQNNSEAIG